MAVRSSAVHWGGDKWFGGQTWFASNLIKSCKQKKTEKIKPK